MKQGTGSPRILQASGFVSKTAQIFSKTAIPQPKAERLKSQNHQKDEQTTPPLAAYCWGALDLLDA